MLLTFLSTVSVPRDGDNNYESDSLTIYYLTWIVHTIVFITLLTNIYFSETLGVLKTTLNTCIMLLYVFFIIYICVDWIFPNKYEKEIDTEVEEGAESTVVEEEVIVEPSLERKRLVFWLQIEVLVFFANIISNMIYLLLRSCSRKRINIKINGSTDCIDEGDDLLEQQ